MDAMSQSPSSPSMFIVVLVSALTAAAVSVGTVVLLGSAKLPWGAKEEPKVVDVPVVVNMAPATAGELLMGRGLRLVVAGERPHPDVAKGAISEQSPLAGSRVDRGGEVRVFVSTGVPLSAVPDLVGKTPADAKTALEAVGLIVGAVQEGGKGAPGTISATTPAAGTSVPRGTAIALQKVPAGGAVPSVVGLSRKKAKEALEAAGFKEGKVKWRYVEDKGPFTVLEQTPAAGATLPPQSPVDLVLNEE